MNDTQESASQLWSGLSHKNSEMVWAAIIAQKSRVKKMRKGVGCLGGRREPKSGLTLKLTAVNPDQICRERSKVLRAISGP